MNKCVKWEADMRRSLSAIEELHKEIEKQYKAGMNIIKTDQNSRRLFDQLVKECPNVAEEDVVRAFATPNIGTKNVEAATIAAVRRKEYNFRRTNGLPMSWEGLPGGK